MQSLRTPHYVCAFLIYLAGFAAFNQAQESRATITGTIVDSSGAAVPNAHVSARNVQTGVTAETVSNQNGLYLIPDLIIGQYTVSASASGFNTVNQSLVLRTGDRASVDFTMQVGSSTQSITVTSEAPLLETSEASTGQVLDNSKIQELPLLGRNPVMLQQYVPGVEFPVNPSNNIRSFDNGGIDNFEISGGRPFTNDTLIDGMSDTAVEGVQPADIAAVPAPDFISEVRVQTMIYDAQYGRTGGGITSMTLKNGTNAFHGAAYYYLRNDILQANSFSANAAGQSRTPFHWSQPGLEVDGPVFIPKLYNGKNKTFFMFGWERIKDSVPSISTETVPTAAERQGNFCQSGPGGGPLIIYDPLSTKLVNGAYLRTPFATPGGCSIPTSAINPVAAKLISYYPPPNQPGETNNYIASPNSQSDLYDAFAYRVDQVLGNKNRLFVSYVRGNRHQILGDAGFPTVASPGYLHWRTNNSATVNWTSTISPSFVSSLTAGWTQHIFAVAPKDTTFDVASLGFPASQVAASPVPGLFPYVNPSNYTSFGNPGWTNSGLYTWSNNYDISENLDKVLGSHDVKFGFEARDMRNDRYYDVANFASFNFDKTFTQAHPFSGDNVSGNSIADLLLGYPTSGSSVNGPRPEYRNYYLATYVQDNWRLSSRLSLNLGLRWDYESPITETHNDINAGFDPTASYTLAGQTLKGQVLFPSNSKFNSPYDSDFKDWGPRLGAAYKLSTHTVIRGGYGIIYAPTYDIGTQVGYSVTTNYIASLNNGATPANSLSNPFPNGFVQPLGAGTNLNGQSGFQFFPNRERDVPRTQQFGIGIQHELPWQTVVDVAYAGTRANHLLVYPNYNALPVSDFALGATTLSSQVANPFAGTLPGTFLNSGTVPLSQTLLPFPQYGSITAVEDKGKTWYNALQVKLEKRMSHGFNVLAAYTYQKTMVNFVSTNNNSLQYNFLNDQDNGTARMLDYTSIPQTLTIAGGYQIPIFQGTSHAFLKGALGGWQLNFIVHARSGQLVGLSGSGMMSTGINPNIANPTRRRWFNTCTIVSPGVTQNCLSGERPAWIVQPAYTLTTLSPYENNLRTPVSPNLDLSLFKAFPIFERSRLEFRAEAFNFTNTPTFGGPNTSVNSAGFGTISNGQANSPREIQLALKLLF